MIACFLSVLSVLSVVQELPTPAFPLKVSDNQRFLVDRSSHDRNPKVRTLKTRGLSGDLLSFCRILEFDVQRFQVS